MRCILHAWTGVMLVGGSLTGHGQAPQLQAVSAIVIDAFTGEALFSKDATKRMYPASTTKILTALLIVEAGNLDAEVLIAPQDTKVEPTIVGFKTGDRYTRKELLHALVLKSANDAALALARDNAGSAAAFCEKMNTRARELGAVSSHFMNPNGLHSPEHFTTAADLALLSRAALQYPTFRELVSTRDYTWRNPGGSIYHLVNRNRLLKNYPGCTGLKTGFTRAAGQTLCSSALRGKDEVIAVVLRTTNQGIWTDSMALLDYGFARLQTRSVKQGEP